MLKKAAAASLKALPNWRRAGARGVCGLLGSAAPAPSSSSAAAASAIPILVELLGLFPGAAGAACFSANVVWPVGVVVPSAAGFSVLIGRVFSSTVITVTFVRGCFFSGEVGRKLGSSTVFFVSLGRLRARCFWHSLLVAAFSLNAAILCRLAALFGESGGRF